MAFLTSHELERYDRQIRIAEIGKGGQEKLKEARVFIAGAGGLGSPLPSILPRPAWAPSGSSIGTGWMRAI